MQAISTLNAQTSVNISTGLEQLKTHKKADTVKAKLLSDIGWQLRNTDIISAINYAHQAANLAANLHFNTGLAEDYSKLGILLKNRGEYDSSVFFFLKSIQLYESLGNKIRLSHAYNNLGTVYRNLEDSTKAFIYFHKSLVLSQILGDSIEIANIYNNMATVYSDFRKTRQERFYDFKSLELYLNAGDNRNMALIYNNLGSLYFHENDFRSAAIFFHKSEALKKLLDDEEGLANTYDNLGEAYSALNRDSALYYYNEAMRLARKTGSAPSQIEILGNLRDYYKKHRDYVKALEVYEIYYRLKDSIFNIEKSKAVAEMQTKYETEKKERQIETLTQDQKIATAENKRQVQFRDFLGIALLLIIIITGILFSRYRFEHRTNKIIESEKKRSDELLLNILPLETTEELKKYGKTTARGYDEVSVMFADIKGFTTISEQMTAQDLVATLDMYFGAFDNITKEYGLEKIKTIGDAYLCAGGLPNPSNGTPVDVVKAAIAMQQYVEKIKIENLAQSKPYFEIRIGIHTGPIVAGVVGIKKFAYDIWGDTVNTAARMEENSETGKVNISAATYEYVKEHFDCTFRGNIDAKNKGLIAMYFVTGEKSFV